MVIKRLEAKHSFRDCASGSCLGDFSIEFGRWCGTVVAEDCLFSELGAAAFIGSLPGSGNFFMLEITFAM